MKKGLDYFVPIVKGDKHFILPGFIEGNFAEAYLDLRDKVLKKKRMSDLEIFSHATMRDNYFTDLNIFEHILAQEILSEFGYRIAQLKDFDEISSSGIMQNQFQDEYKNTVGPQLMLGASLYGGRSGKLYHAGNLWDQLRELGYDEKEVPVKFNYGDLEMFLDKDFEDGIDLRIKKDCNPQVFTPFHWTNGYKGFDSISGNFIKFKKATESKYTLHANKFDGIMNYTMTPNNLIHNPNFQFPDANRILLFKK